jgi:hypothetical protein
MLECFIIFKCLIENLLSYKIKQLQTDGVANTPLIPLNNFCQHTAYITGSHFLTHPSKIGLLKGRIDMSLRQGRSLSHGRVPHQLHAITHLLNFIPFDFWVKTEWVLALG